MIQTPMSAAYIFRSQYHKVYKTTVKTMATKPLRMSIETISAFRNQRSWKILYFAHSWIQRKDPARILSNV